MRLAQALAGRVPVLGIANPSNFHPTGDVVPKLELPDDSWKEILHTLVRSASLIVIEARHFSPGVAYELNTIREHDKQDFAIVVVLRKGSDDTDRIRLIRELAEILIESDVAPPEQLSKQSEQLIDFPRVVNEDEVPFDNLDSSPYFADILAQIDFFVALNPEQRRKRVQANIANRNGVALMREGRLTDAQGPLLEGLALRQEIGDMIGQVISYQNVGTMFKGLEDYATAESHYRSGLKGAQELGDKVGARLLLSGLAEIRRISGDAGSALAFLQEASELLDQNRKPKELMLILHSIGELRRKGDENALAIAAYTRAAEIAREAHEEATLALSLREIGVTFARNDDPSNAIPPVLESLEISRKLGDVQSEGEALVLLATLSHKAEDEPRVQQYSRDALALYKRTGGPEIAKSVQEVLERHGVVLHVDANSLMRNGSEIRNTETGIGLVLIADCLTSRSSGRREKAAPLLTLGVIAPRKAWRCFPGESPCRVRANHPPVSSLASVAESRGDEFARDHLVQ
jgi:tetratricopeptide (TPR) repeat protein